MWKKLWKKVRMVKLYAKNAENVTNGLEFKNNEYPNMKTGFFLKDNACVPKLGLQKCDNPTLSTCNVCMPNNKECTDGTKMNM